MIGLYEMDNAIASDKFYVEYFIHDDYTDYIVKPVAVIRDVMYALPFTICEDKLSVSKDKAKDILANKLALQTVNSKKRSWSASKNAKPDDAKASGTKLKIKFWCNKAFTMSIENCDKILCDIEIATLDKAEWCDIDVSYNSIVTTKDGSLMVPRSYKNRSGAFESSMVYLIMIDTSKPFNVQISPMD